MIEINNIINENIEIEKYSIVKEESYIKKIWKKVFKVSWELCYFPIQIILTIMRDINK